MRRRPRSRPEALGDLVPKVLGELGYDRANALTRMAECWERFVGPQAAAHSRPTGLRGRLLEATVDSSVWSHQLQMRREEILAALAAELGEDAPTDLWLRVG